MDECDRFLESDHLISQRAKKRLKTIRLAIGFSERQRIAKGSASRVGLVESGVCLTDDHYRDRVSCLRNVKRVHYPGNVCGIADCILVGVRIRVAKVIA